MTHHDPTTVNERLGEIVRDGELTGLRFERHLSQPPERVWRALTESDELHHWLPCDIVGPRTEGAPITLRFWPEVTAEHPEAAEAGDLPGRITEWDPPKVFAWTWDTDELRFELEASATGTRLVFTTWIGETPGIESTAAGYHACFEQLVDMVDHGGGGTVVDRDPRALEDVYRQRWSEDGSDAPAG